MLGSCDQRMHVCQPKWMKDYLTKLAQKTRRKNGKRIGLGELHRVIVCQYLLDNNGRFACPDRDDVYFKTRQAVDKWMKRK